EGRTRLLCNGPVSGWRSRHGETPNEDRTMREAVIVAAKRTPIGKAYRGAFNNTYGATLGAEAIRAAVAQAGVDPGEIDDVAMGVAIQQGTTGNNIARQAALRAGLPNTVSGMTIDRQCS